MTVLVAAWRPAPLAFQTWAVVCYVPEKRQTLLGVLGGREAQAVNLMASRSPLFSPTGILLAVAMPFGSRVVSGRTVPALEL